jgi:16S rRNA processing protein RimM
MSRLVLVGRVSGAFGVRGEVRIAAYTEDPMSLVRFKRLLREDGSHALTLQGGRAAKDGVVTRCPEIATKEAADALRGLRLYVPREALPPPQDEDEFYLTDLIGLAAATPEGRSLGTVKAVQNFGAGDILELDPGGGRATVFIPFTRACVPEVLVAEGRVVVVPPADDPDAEPEDAGPEQEEEAG